MADAIGLPAVVLGEFLWVAASALEHGAVLASHDARFGQVDGLVVARRPEDLMP